MMQRFICLVIGYAFGLFQSSYIIGKVKGVDIRKVGSGNPGSTNTLRTFGAKAGLTCLFLDVMKCVLAIWLVNYLFQGSGKDILPLLGMYAGAGCVLGHNYPFYLNFKGGKGVASSLGLIIATDYRIPLIVMWLFFFIFFTSHYVSVASMCTYVAALISLGVFAALGSYGMDLPHTVEMVGIFAILTLQMLWRHRANIARLKAGTERKTYLTHKSE